MDAIQEVFIFLIDLAPVSFGVSWKKFGFSPFVQFIEEDIREDGTHYCTLRYSAQCLVERPVLHIPCIKEFSHEIEKPSLVNVLLKCLEEEFVFELIKTLRDVALYEPCASMPGIIDFPERGVASSFGTKIHANVRRTAVRNLLPA